MDRWLKNLIMLIVLLLWGSAMAYWVFIMHVMPDAITWGVPGGVYLALNPQLPRLDRKDAPCEE